MHYDEDFYLLACVDHIDKRYLCLFCLSGHLPCKYFVQNKIHTCQLHNGPQSFFADRCPEKRVIQFLLLYIYIYICIYIKRVFNNYFFLSLLFSLSLAYAYFYLSFFPSARLIAYILGALFSKYIEITLQTSSRTFLTI